MPMANGYTIYVAGPSVRRSGWLVRVYREVDDKHIHSAESCGTLQIGMREAERAIIEDSNALREASAHA